MGRVVRAAILQTEWTGDKDSMIERNADYARKAAEQGAQVIIGGLKFPLRDRGFAKRYQDLADQTGVVLIPNIFKGIIGNRKLMSDPIHPNGEGYKLMAERFLEAMLS